MLTEITVRQIQRHVQLKTPIPRICADVGVGRAVVYRLISEGFDERIERMRRKKKEPRPRTPCRSYKDALPPEQWQGARVLIGILQRLKGMGDKPQIDLESLRDVWQRKMDEVVN